MTVKPGKKKSLSLDYSCSLHSCYAADGDPGTFDSPFYNLLLWLADDERLSLTQERFLRDLHTETRLPTSPRRPSNGFCRRVGPDCFSLHPNPSIQSPFTLWILYRELLQAKQIKHHLSGCSTAWQQISRSNHCCHGKQSLFSLFFFLPPWTFNYDSGKKKTSAHFHWNHMG